MEKAVIPGIKPCETYHKKYINYFISVIPAILSGTNDNYYLQESYNLSALIKEIVVSTGGFKFNSTMPYGNPKKISNVSKPVSLKSKYKINLEKGIKNASKIFNLIMI